MFGVVVRDPGSFVWSLGSAGSARANFPLHIIRMARNAGCEFEDLADGFGKGHGTMGGDWSGIRDSSEGATNEMLERALNFINDKLGN
jgi:hypothetical protein